MLRALLASLVSFLARWLFFVFFFFNDTATTEIYTLSLHDALPISWKSDTWRADSQPRCWAPTDRKSTRLNSSHGSISYAVFCLKKQKHRRYATSSGSAHRSLMTTSNTAHV